MEMNMSNFEKTFTSSQEREGNSAERGLNAIDKAVNDYTNMISNQEKVDKN